MLKRLTIGIILAALVTGTLWLIVDMGSTVLAQEGESNVYELLTTFNRVLQVISRDYVEEESYDDLIYGAISGMLATLDPHSMLMEQPMYDNLRLETSGKFGGLGMQVQITAEDDTLTVMSPFDGTPAAEAGLEPGDKILAIDGESTFDMDINEAVGHMRGEPGSEVVLTIYRPGIPGSIDYTMTRAEIEVESVPDHFMVDAITGYVRISDFAEDTVIEFSEALLAMEALGMERLIVDLRNNPGGTLIAAVEISEVFSENGNLVVYTEGRNPETSREEFHATAAGYRFDKPVIVLVDNGSASASEIVTGAVKAWDRAIIVGTTTFGKGSVQTLYPLAALSPGAPENMAVKLTIARYYTPDGVCIDGVGIDPDVYLETVFYTAFSARFVAAGYHRALATEYRLSHSINTTGSFEALSNEGLTTLISDFMAAQEDPFSFAEGEIAGETVDQLRISVTAELLTQLGGTEGRHDAARYRLTQDTWIAEVLRLWDDPAALEQARAETFEKLAELAEEKENADRLRH
jgi:carboxyl-terminal processing protease